MLGEDTIERVYYMKPVLFSFYRAKKPCFLGELGWLLLLPRKATPPEIRAAPDLKVATGIQHQEDNGPPLLHAGMHWGRRGGSARQFIIPQSQHPAVNSLGNRRTGMPCQGK
jgi:hypothetical protein